MNTTTQYHLGKYLWPELESNSTYFHGGPNDGKTQSFVTPGLTAARRLHPASETSRLRICLGGAVQIAASHFHSYNHGLIFTSRFLF